MIGFGFGLSKASPKAMKKHIGISETASVIGARIMHIGTMMKYILLRIGC
jgi:hypothetical protein